MDDGRGKSSAGDDRGRFLVLEELDDSESADGSSCDMTSFRGLLCTDAPGMEELKCSREGLPVWTLEMNAKMDDTGRNVISDGLHQRIRVVWRYVYLQLQDFLGESR